jgi:AcrR family transcriptional regulator
MENKQAVQKLDRQQWIAVGLQVLADSGIDSVRVEPIAKLMKVTKGSFYWHFKNRDDLLAAILQEWVDTETHGLIDRVETLGGDATVKLLHLFELATKINGRLENAVRGWSIRDPKIAATLLAVDRDRLNYTKKLFLELGFSPIAAEVRARMAYFSLVGECTVGITRDDPATDLDQQAETLAAVRIEHAILTRKDAE